MKTKTSINGDRWTYRIVTTDEMAEQRDDGDELAGLAVPGERTVYIEENNVNLEIILHETYHAYFSYLYLDDTTELKLNDLEEITCVFFCNKSIEILKKGKEMYKKLKKLQQRGR